MSKYSDDEWNAMVELLTYVAAADRRTIGETDVEVWLDAAVDGQWPSMEAAQRAVRVHRSEQPGKWLEPGHVTQVLARVRREASASYRPPMDRDIPHEVLNDPAAYQAHMRDAAARHQTQVMTAFASGRQQLAIEAAS